MTTPNYFGWTDERASERFEKRKAEAIAYEVFNASTLTDEEIEALDEALEACATEPQHILLNAETFWTDTETEIVTRELAPKTAAFLPPANGITTLQEWADAKDKSFNRRYYNNPDGKPEWRYR